MAALVKSVHARFDALTLRERVVVAGAGLVALLLGWYLLWGDAAMQLASRHAAERETLQGQLDSLQAQLAQGGPAMSADLEARAQLAGLAERADRARALIDEYTAELISPTEMARVLEKILGRQHTLRLTRLANLGAEDLLPQDVPGEQRLYRHRFEMELVGPYLQCLAYLEDLERLPWRLYWQAVEIDADSEGYPNNRIRIEVATMSLHEDWIGV